MVCTVRVLYLISPVQAEAKACTRMTLTPPLPHARICTHFDDPPSPQACVRTIRMPPNLNCQNAFLESSDELIVLSIIQPFYMKFINCHTGGQIVPGYSSLQKV